MSQPTPGSGSLLLAEEYFAAEDPRFLQAFRAVRAPRALAGFVDRWKRDVRPFARAQILTYLAEPLNSVCHNVVVKRWFKHAEEHGDDEIMAAMLVALDVSIRRVRKTRQRYDWRSREIWSEEKLVTPRDVLPRELTIKRTDWRGREHTMPADIPRNGRLFTHRTRAYLRRRAWRYFRKLGYQHPERYVPVIARALREYKDDNLAQGENILDSWGLVHACFHAHSALDFTASQIRLKQGRSIGDLTPAPQFVALWRSPQGGTGGTTFFALIGQARSRLVRLWAMELLRQEHASRLAARSSANRSTYSLGPGSYEERVPTQCPQQQQHDSKGGDGPKRPLLQRGRCGKTPCDGAGPEAVCQMIDHSRRAEQVDRDHGESRGRSSACGGQEVPDLADAR
jgi:hypothetical protein